MLKKIQKLLLTGDITNRNLAIELCLSQNMSVDEMVELISLINQETKLPILAKPNAGKPQLLEGKTIYPTTAEDFSEDIIQIVQNGANVVGGCCGSNPEYINKISNKIKEY